MTEAAPEFSIEAAVSGRTVTKKNGTLTVLVFHGPKTTDAPKQVGKAVRAAHPEATDVLVANIVDLRSMGGLWKKVATAGINQNYEKLASKLGDSAPDYVLICPDWDGAVTTAFGFTDANKTAAIVVLDGEGNLLGRAEGDGLADAALAALG